MMEVEWMMMDATELRQLVIQLKKEIEEGNNFKMRIVPTLKSKLEAIKTTHQQEISLLKQDNDRMAALLKDTQSKLSEVELQRQKDAHEKDKMNHLEQQLKQNIILHNDNIKQLEMRIKQFEFRANISESRLKEEQIKVQDGKEKIAKFAQITKKLQNDLQKANNDLYNMNGILEAFRGAAQEIKNLKIRIEGLNEELEQYRSADLMQKEIVESIKQEAKQSKLNGEIELKKAQQEISNLQLIQHQLKQEMKELNDTISSKDELMVTLTKEKNEEIEKILITSRTEFASLQDNLTNTYNDLTIVTSQLNKVRLSEKNLLTENAKLRDKNAASISEIDHLQSASDILYGKIEQLQNTISKLHEENQILKKNQAVKVQKPVLCLTEKDENIPQNETRASQSKGADKKRKEISKSKSPRTSAEGRSQQTSRSSTAKGVSSRSSPIKRKKRQTGEESSEVLSSHKRASKHTSSKNSTQTKHEKRRKSTTLEDEDLKVAGSEADSLVDLSRRLEEMKEESVKSVSRGREQVPHAWDSGYLDALVNEFSQFSVPSISTSSNYSSNLNFLEGLSDFSE